MVMIPMIRASKHIIISGGGMVTLTLEVFMAVRMRLALYFDSV